MPKKKHSGPKNSEHGEEMSLVPMYAGVDIMPGIQAYRRGEVILYTIRGEPRQVRELMGELDRTGVDEVVALITHPASPPAEPERVPQHQQNEPDPKNG